MVKNVLRSLNRETLLSDDELKQLFILVKVQYLFYLLSNPVVYSNIYTVYLIYDRK